MLNVVISFDYELFMGQNFVSEEDVLIKPSSKLSKMLRSVGVSATFFADVLCPIRYRELGLTQFPDAFDNQLVELNQDGHDVQLHIHPHWLKATKVGKEVEFERDSYRIHNWIKDNGDTNPVKDLIHQGKEYLVRVVGQEDKNYRCVAFRAGGYCLQPESLIAPLLYTEGIRIDSSVCYGRAYNSDGMAYDYTKMPQTPNIYFSEKIGLRDGVVTKPKSFGILEVPVWGYKSFPYRVIASKKNGKISDEKATGYGMSIKKPKPLTIVDRIKGVFTGSNMLTFDFYNAKSIVYMINKISRQRMCRDKDVYISIISHPKSQSDQHIENMRNAIRELEDNQNVRFVSMSEIANIKEL